MEIKTIAPVTVACYKLKTNLIRIGESVQVIPNQIAQEIAVQNLQVTGAQIWQYVGCDGTPDKEFDLTIAFPVSAKGTNNKLIQFETLPAYKCASHTHNGAWSEFKEVYCTLVQQISEKGHKMDGSNRELYLHCDFENQENCVTEIQMGLI
ncbi:MAG: GyrI-like domain-containing protein [Bacteroidales bacterium]|nr:GyrI-like domain-containing protein [Bacteroidales bacterium]